MLINTVNPMQLAFITSFKVENQSGLDVWITPIGTRGIAGRKTRLPIYMTAVPALHSFNAGRFYLKNGQTIKIRYDWDDINFSEIAVESPDGQFYQLVVNPNPLENQYHAPRSRHFLIPDLKTLSPIQSDVLNVAIKPDLQWISSLCVAGSVFVWILFIRMLKAYKRLPCSRNGL
jgi:hypothetical protein